MHQLPKAYLPGLIALFLAMLSFIIAEGTLSFIGRQHGIGAIVAFLVCAYSVIAYVAVSASRPGEKQWQGAGFAFLCFLSLAIMSLAYAEHSSINPGQQFIMDGSIDRWVYELFRNGLASIPYESIGVQEKGVLYLYSVVAVLSGEFNAYLFVLVNWIAHVASSLLLYAITVRAFGRPSALLATGLFLVIPENLYWGGTIYKDGIVVMLVLAAIHGFLRAVFDGRRIHWLTLVLALCCIAFFRSGLLAAVMMAGAVSLACGGRRLFPKLAEYVVALTLGAAVFATIFPAPVTADVWNKAFGRIYGKLAEGSSYSLDSYNITYRTSKEDSLVERYGGGDISLGNAYVVPLRVASYLFVPFPPWESRFKGDRYILPSTWLIMALLAYFASGFIRSAFGGVGPAMTLCVFFICLGAAIAFAGPFVYERYRLLITPIYLAVSSSVLVASPWSIRLRLFMASAGIVAAALLLWSILRAQA